MEEENSEPEQVRLYLLSLFESSQVELAFKALLLFILLSLSGFLMALESAFETTINKSRNGDKALEANTPQIKGAFTILQFLVRTGAGICFAELIRHIFDITNQHVFYFLVLCFVFGMLVYGQWTIVLAPKNKDYQKNTTIQSLLHFCIFLLSPLSGLLNKLKKYARLQLKQKGYYLREAKVPNMSETNLIKVAESFNQTTVKQVMRSRMDITAIDIDIDFNELVENLNQSGFSRVPVYRETIDKIEGVFYMKDVLPYIGRTKEFPWQNLIRPAYFVPENKKIEELLREFQEKHAHMALVVDGYGGISGLITLEDILEEIVGEINDELDEVDLNYIKLDDKTYIFEGKTSLNDFFKITGTDSEIFEDVKGESESLGGVLLQMNSNLPKKGDKIFFKNFVFRIDSANNKRIKKIKVEILEEKEVNQDAEN